MLLTQCVVPIIPFHVALRPLQLGVVCALGSRAAFVFLVAMLPLACADWDWILVSVFDILLGGPIGTPKETVQLFGFGFFFTRS